MTQTVQQIYGYNNPSTNPERSFLIAPGRVGIEIELEGLANFNRSMDKWDVIHEDSLRDGGKEFITKGDGLGGLDLLKAIEEIDSLMTESGPVASWRCSNHVHVDVRHFTVSQIKKFILLSLILEDVIYDSAGYHRKDSNFCVPISKACRYIELLGKNWDRDGIDFLNNVIGSMSTYDSEPWSKYAGLNLLSIKRLGTIEFRNSEPKYKRGELLRLVNRYLSIADFVYNFSGTETEMVNSIDETFCKKLLSRGLRKDFKINVDKLEDGKYNALDVINFKPILMNLYQGMLADNPITVSIGTIENTDAKHYVDAFFGDRSVLNIFSLSKLRQELPESIFDYIIVDTIARDSFSSLYAYNESLRDSSFVNEALSLNL